MKKNNKKNGFTLFELLVSISIIAVLTAVSVVSFGGLNKKTRDTRRITDLEKIRVALESARLSGSTYPVAVGNTANLTNFLDRWPVDPKTNSPYRYTPATSTYYICATVELPSSTTPDITGCSGLPPSGYAGYARVINP